MSTIDDDAPARSIRGATAATHNIDAGDGPAAPTLSEDRTQVITNMRLVNEHLTCPLCKNYFRKPFVLVDCQHTFCHHCLVDSIRRQGASCPLASCPSKLTGNAWEKKTMM
jgi:late competence protein required for DNA uptake (superfamily II DNA/RNA helicase)